MLTKRVGKTTPLWIPGHHGITGNEEADACTKQAAAITDGAPRPVSFAAASALIRLTITTHRLATAEQRRSTLRRFHCRPAVGLPLRVLLTRLRTGHILLRKAYAYHLNTEGAMPEQQQHTGKT